MKQKPNSFLNEQILSAILSQLNDPNYTFQITLSYRELLHAEGGPRVLEEQLGGERRLADNLGGDEETGGGQEEGAAPHGHCVLVQAVQEPGHAPPGHGGHPLWLALLPHQVTHPVIETLIRLCRANARYL